jgi:hypothetical protein
VYSEYGFVNLSANPVERYRGLLFAILIFMANPRSDRQEESLLRLLFVIVNGPSRTLPEFARECRTNSSSPWRRCWLNRPIRDQALNLFKRLITEAREQTISMLNSNRVLPHYAISLLGHTYWLGETLIHNQDILYSLQREKNLERSPGREDYRDHFARLSFETDVCILLARFKNASTFASPCRAFWGRPLWRRLRRKYQISLMS